MNAEKCAGIMSIVEGPMAQLYIAKRNQRDNIYIILHGATQQQQSKSDKHKTKFNRVNYKGNIIG